MPPKGLPVWKKDRAAETGKEAGNLEKKQETNGAHEKSPGLYPRQNTQHTAAGKGRRHMPPPKATPYS